MGKAIYGAVGGPDPRVLAELATLRARVNALVAPPLATLPTPTPLQLTSLSTTLPLALLFLWP